MRLQSYSSIQIASERWQKQFFLIEAGGQRGRGYYKAIKTGELYGPLDFNTPLIDTPVVVLFNTDCPPCSQAINDWFARTENGLLEAVDRVAKKEHGSRGQN